MANANNSFRFVTAQFCDDIRQEIGNKYSLIGCYQEELILDKTPSILPKFAVMAMITTPKERPFSKLIVRALLNEDTIAEIEIPADQMAAGFASKANKPENVRLAVQVAMVLSPLGITERSNKLQIQAETEEGTLNGNFLIIHEKSSES